MDKLAAANKINEFLQSVVTNGGLHLEIPHRSRPARADRLGETRNLRRLLRPRLDSAAGSRRRTSPRPRTLGFRNPPPAFGRARKDFFRLQEPAFHPSPGTPHGGQRRRRKSSPDRNPVPLRSHVIARAPHRPPRPPRPNRPPHRKRRRRLQPLRSPLSGRLQTRSHQSSPPHVALKVSLSS